MLYPTGTRVTIPEGNWVVFGSEWGRVLADTPTDLGAEVEIEPSGRVSQDTLASTAYAASILTELGHVMPLPAGAVLRIPAGTTVTPRGAGSKTGGTPAESSTLLWVAGVLALGVVSSYVGAMLFRRYGRGG